MLRCFGIAYFLKYSGMSSIAKKQGDDFSFSVIIYAEAAKINRFNLDNLADLKINVYTDGCFIARFSKNAATGYTQLIRVSETEYKAVVDSSLSRVMAPGAINVDVNVAQTSGEVADGKYNMQASAQIGSLAKITTKNES